MTAREIKPGIYQVGAIDWDRKLFDEIIPLPEGTSYNSYLIKGSEKTALLDTVDPTKTQELITNLITLGITHIDYVIAHHAEQDHSGSLMNVLETFPSAKLVTNPKCKEMLIDLLQIPEGAFIEVKDGETLSLGNKSLKFIYAPWVHWPETMFTYCAEDKTLFTCDFLGSHLATSELFADKKPEVYRAAKRYYAEIMMPFRFIINKNMEKIKDLAIDMACPSHGPVYNKPEFMLNAYREWISDAVKNEVVLPYVSMHGSTLKMVEYFTDCLMKRGITVKPFNLPRTDLGDLAMSLVDAATIVVASPTFLTGAHPSAIYGVELANALRPKTKFASIIGSYGWGSKMVDQIKGLMGNLKVELMEPVLVKGYPQVNDFKALDVLADTIQKRHKENNIV